MQENSDNIKGKTNKSFRLKEINDKLVVQQYEDIVRGEVEDTSEAVDDQMEYSQ